MSRLLFIHAHPDDESLWTGVGIAHHVRRGDQVHVLTCTLGEEGEVIPGDLRHLELPAGEPRDWDGIDALAQVRREELRAATEALGVASSTVLGEVEGRDRLFRDSGMVGSPAAEHPRAFAAASVQLAASLVAAHIERVQADAVITYDDQGGYGHPDHIQTHRVAREAVRLADHHPRLYAVATPASWAREDRLWLAEHLRDPSVQVPAADDPYPPSVVADDLVSVTVEDSGTLAVQQAALRCHRTQVEVHEGWFALSNAIASRLPGREGYVRIDPDTGRPINDSGRVDL